MAYISGAVEGPTDEVVLRRIVEQCGAATHRVQVQGGKGRLQRALPGYNAAAQGDPWLVLVDLDRDFPCAPALVSTWMPAPSRYMRFRVAVPQIEAWLLADTEGFSSFFRVRRSVIPAVPDDVPDAKAALLAAVGHSRRRDIQEDMLPRPGSGRRVGPAYTSRLIEFASGSESWRLEAAAHRSPSLAGCLSRLRELISLAP